MPTKPWSITAEANARPMTPWGCGPAMRTAWRYMDMTACCDRVAAFGASSCTAGGRGEVWKGVVIVQGQGRPPGNLIVGTTYSTLSHTHMSEEPHKVRRCGHMSDVKLRGVLHQYCIVIQLVLPQPALRGGECEESVREEGASTSPGP